jgi:hypothetical protein
VSHLVVPAPPCTLHSLSGPLVHPLAATKV